MTAIRRREPLFSCFVVRSYCARFVIISPHYCYLFINFQSTAEIIVRIIFPLQWRLTFFYVSSDVPTIFTAQWRVFVGPVGGGYYFWKWQKTPGWFLQLTFSSVSARRRGIRHGAQFCYSGCSKYSTHARTPRSLPTKSAGKSRQCLSDCST